MKKCCPSGALIVVHSPSGGRQYVVMTIGKQVLQLQLKDNVAIAVESYFTQSRNIWCRSKDIELLCVENIRGLSD